MKKLTDQKIRAIIQRDWVGLDDSELTPGQLDAAVSDFHHWRRCEPGLDHLFRLRVRTVPLGANEVRLAEFTGRYTWDLTHKRRQLAPADSRPIRLSRARSGED